MPRKESSAGNGNVVATDQIIDRLPDDLRVALRVFGHRIRERQPGDCQDSELVVPFGKIDKARLRDRVRRIQALGTTPIAYSLQQVGRDFGTARGEKMVILVTDAKEECGGSLSAAVSELLAKELGEGVKGTIKRRRLRPGGCAPRRAPDRARSARRAGRGGRRLRRLRRAEPVPQPPPSPPPLTASMAERETRDG